MKLTPELKRAAFLQLLKNEHVPAPKLEYVFCTERKFAADYYWDINGVRLMLELQGGVEPVVGMQLGTNTWNNIGYNLRKSKSYE